MGKWTEGRAFELTKRLEGRGDEEWIRLGRKERFKTH